MFWNWSFFPIIIVSKWFFRLSDEQSQVLCGFKDHFHIRKVIWVNLAFIYDLLSAPLNKFINLLFIIHDKPNILIFIEGSDEPPPSPNLRCKLFVLVDCDQGWVLVNSFDWYAFAVQIIEDFSALEILVKIKLRVKRWPLLDWTNICLRSGFLLKQ